MHGQLVRTNNSVESFHKYLLTKIGRAHPNVWIFLKKIQEVEHSKAVQLTRVQNGLQPLEVRRIRYRVADQVIRDAEAALLIDGDVERFLRNVCHQSSDLIRTLGSVAGII